MTSLTYNSNPNLKSNGVNVGYTEDQVLEYIKCRNDPIYFIENYIKILTLDDGLILFKLFDYQINFINSIHNNDRTIGMFPRQHGKCFEKTTKYKVRNKITGETLYVNAEEFHKNMQKL